MPKEIIRGDSNVLTYDDITTVDKLQCVQRELGMRKSVYPKWVEQGRMSAGKAALEIACMEAIVQDYRRLLPRAQGGPSTPTPPPPAAA